MSIERYYQSLPEIPKEAPKKEPLRLGGRTPAEPRMEVTAHSEKMMTPEKPLRETADVNGMKIVLGWYGDKNDYELYFPQVKLDVDKDVWDQVITISRRPEVAKAAFDYAARTASELHDVYDLYKKVREYARDLPYDLEGYPGVREDS